MRSGSTRFTIGVLIVMGLIAGAVVLRSDRFGTTSGTVHDSEEIGAHATLEDSPNPPPSHPRPAGGAQFYVAPGGKADGDGTKSRPWDLASAVSSHSKLKPGDTLWLRGGVYKGRFRSKLAGKQGQSILVCQLTDERATIDGSLIVDGEWTTFWGFEVTNSNPDRAAERPTAVEINGAHTKFINLIVHDGGNGFGFWSSAVDAELYGNIIYNNGWREIDRGHGHGVYTQNEEGTKLIRDNIIFNQYGWGIHAYSEEGSLSGLRFEGNVAFNNGAPAGARYDNILVGGRQPAERIVLASNYTYETPTEGLTKPNVRLHYEATNNKDLTVTDNYFAGGSPVTSVANWLSVTMTGNTFHGSGSLLELSLPQGVAPTAYTWDNNFYYQGEQAAPFSLNGRALDFSGWRKASGFDHNGAWVTSKTEGPGQNEVFIRRNQYEPDRAHIIVYHWSLKNIIDVDLKGLLKVGESYEVRSVEHFFGAPVLGGTFDGGPLRLPMTGLRVVAPVGSRAPPEPTGPIFNVFVLFSGRLKGEAFNK